jgi:hypothetical protein
MDERGRGVIGGGVALWFKSAVFVRDTMTTVAGGVLVFELAPNGLIAACQVCLPKRGQG